MNRKERRATRAHGAKSARSSAAVAPDPNLLAGLFNAAVAQHQAGALAEAERQYRHILTLFANHPDTHSRLGAVLMAQGKVGEAIPHLESAAALNPDLFEAIGGLAQAYWAAGKVQPAIEAARRALELRETAQGKAFFAQCVRFARFTSDDGRFRKLILRALVEGWARPRDLTGVSISLVKLNPALREGIARTSAAWPTRLAAAELFGATEPAALAQDELLCRLLESDPITDVGIERLLTNVRYAGLGTNATDDAANERSLPFFCTVACQCFINEYVFSITEAEADQAGQLRASLDAAIASREPFPVLWLAVVGAYYPLHTLSNAEELLAGSWPECIRALIIQQIKEPAEEQRIATAIPALTGIESEVSRAVRQQYEESPYPRWTRTAVQAHSGIVTERPPQHAFDALIAGCGTGLSTIEFARQARNARILAIDLSLASLSYAKRMAESFGLTNVEFAQADIMQLGSIGKNFDVIDASGVLHHLADPWAGWRILLSLLRPGGAMQVALYSELARQNVIAARAFIAERGYRPIPDDIRRCREAIIASDDPLLRSLTQWDDFFATNGCRDMLFHVQEHRVTLPEIKSFVAATGLQFSGLLADAATLSRFAARFPKRENLADFDCWQAFEAEAPQVFANMYQFWVHKPVAAPH